RFLVGAGVLADADAALGGVADDPVLDVGDVDHVRQAIAAEAEVPPEQVVEEEGPEVADVREVPDGWAAGVEADVPGLERFELLLAAAGGVVQEECHVEVIRGARPPGPRCPPGGRASRGPRARSPSPRPGPGRCRASRRCCAPYPSGAAAGGELRRSRRCRR